MILLGLDQSPQVTGFCYGEPGGKPTWGEHHHPDYGANTQLAKREMRTWLLQFCNSVGIITSLYFEQIIVYPERIDTNDLHKQFGQIAAIELVADQLGIEAYEVAISDWRKLFLGRANAPKLKPRPGMSNTDWLKDAARKACAERGWLVASHHAAEACGIWHFACACENQTYRLEAKAAMRRAELAQDRERAGGFV